ncbi:MAG TPA: rhomboid-like protein [Kineosporiaceae bacterium]
MELRDPTGPRRPQGGRPEDPLRRVGRAVLTALPYPLLLVAGTLSVDALPDRSREAWLRYVSTDLANLGDHPLPCLLLSAFVTEGELVAWAVLGLAGLAALGVRFGAWRALTLAFAVHLLATLVSQGLVAYRIGTGALPGSDRLMSDIGPSYVVVAALVAALGHGTRWGRVVGAVGFAVLAPSLFGGLADLDVAAVGHVVSVALALVLGWPVAWWAAAPAGTSGPGPARPDAGPGIPQE